LAERADDPADSLQRIEKEANELETLITGLLTLARIESGQSQLEKQSLALCELLTKIVEDANYEGQATQRIVSLNHCDRVMLTADPVMLHSAIENVVRNALRYTPPDSKISINVHQSHDSVTITVDDQGEGVPPQAIDKLFEPFARVAEARDRLSGGYGLGLAITGKVIQAHAGQVTAENREEGGLRVTLTLPCSSST
ncbi:MAG: ATP-binding protein, partial [Gammaproteobacteria bacterium]|nr:ATP-binding protein [Gammaproteobacteria bacterium]